MSNRMNNALLHHATEMGVADYSSVANIAEGAQLGIGPNIPKLDASTPLVMNPVILVVTHFPAMWDSYPKLQMTLKKLIECHPKSVTGIDFGYTLETHQSLVGHDGQNLETPMQTKRGPVNPAFTWQEIYGNLVWNIHYQWLCHIQHPDTQASLLSAASDENNVPPWLVSSYSMAMCAIQFDPTMLPDRIIDAAFYTAMVPTETGDIGFERTVGQSKSPERSITYKAVVQHNNNTRELGRVIAKSLQLHKPNYQLATTASGISSNLANLGIEKEARDAIADFRLMG